MKVYGPDETWPEEKLSSEFRDAFDAAHAAGWTLYHLGAPHTFGLVRCPSGEHSFKITCTARNQQMYAAQGLRDVRNCPHGTGATGSKVAQRKERCDELLTTADSLLDDIESGLTLAESYDASIAELHRLTLELDTAESNIAVAVRLADETRTESGPGVDEPAHEVGEVTGDGIDAALQAVYERENAPTREALEAQVGQVDETLTEARSVARQLRKGRPRLAKGYDDRVQTSVGRADAARDRIGRLMSDRESGN